MLDAEKTRVGLHKIINDLEAQTGKKFAEMPWEFRDYVKAYARHKIDFGEINSGETLAKFLHEEIRIYMADKKVNEFADFKIDPKKYAIDPAWLEPLPIDRKVGIQDMLNKEMDKMRDSLPQMFINPRGMGKTHAAAEELRKKLMFEGIWEAPRADLVYEIECSSFSFDAIMTAIHDRSDLKTTLDNGSTVYNALRKYTENNFKDDLIKNDDDAAKFAAGFLSNLDYMLEDAGAGRTTINKTLRIASTELLDNQTIADLCPGFTTDRQSFRKMMLEHSADHIKQLLKTDEEKEFYNDKDKKVPVIYDDPLKDRPLTLPLLGKQELDKIDAIINLMHGDSKFKVSDIYHVAKIVHEENDELRKRIDAPRPAVEVKALTAEVGLIHMPWHDRLATDIKLARTIAVRGPAGNGKSTGVKGVLESAGYNIYHLDCNDSTAVDQLVGGLEPVPDGKGGIKMEFKDGVFAKAFKDEKGAIQLDEFDALDPRVTMSLQSALHRVPAGKKRMVSCPDHPVGVLYAVGDCPIVVTMNTWGIGATREYVGRNAIDAASLDRFDTIINTDYQCEAEMLEKMGLAATDRASLLREIFSLRKKIKDKGLRVLLSTRRVLNMGEAILSLDCTVPAAISREFVERLDDYDRETLGLGLVK